VACADRHRPGSRHPGGGSAGGSFTAKVMMPRMAGGWWWALADGRVIERQAAW
jgi:hypothetical protein